MPETVHHYTGKVGELILSFYEKREKGFIVLIDPDELTPDAAATHAQMAEASGACMVFIGGSLILDPLNFSQCVSKIKEVLNLPVVLFPGGIYQVSPDADAILFLSLISGRNPEMLIGRHVESAGMIRKSGLEVIPTGYLLIQSGGATSVHYMSNTQPIPGDKPDIALATAMAGEMLGLKLIYLEAGSGATAPVHPSLISTVTKGIDIPVIVGGGIRTVEAAAEAFEAGADLIVVGTAAEGGDSSHFLQSLKTLSRRIH